MLQACAEALRETNPRTELSGDQAGQPADPATSTITPIAPSSPLPPCVSQPASESSPASSPLPPPELSPAASAASSRGPSTSPGIDRARQCPLADDAEVCRDQAAETGGLAQVVESSVNQDMNEDAGQLCDGEESKGDGWHVFATPDRARVLLGPVATPVATELKLKRAPGSPHMPPQDTTANVLTGVAVWGEAVTHTVQGLEERMEQLQQAVPRALAEREGIIAELRGSLMEQLLDMRATVRELTAQKAETEAALEEALDLCQEQHHDLLALRQSADAGVNEAGMHETLSTTISSLETLGLDLHVTLSAAKDEATPSRAGIAASQALERQKHETGKVQMQLEAVRAESAAKDARVSAAMAEAKALHAQCDEVMTERRRERVSSSSRIQTLIAKVDRLQQHSDMLVSELRIFRASCSCCKPPPPPPPRTEGAHKEKESPIPLAWRQDALFAHEQASEERDDSQDTSHRLDNELRNDGMGSSQGDEADERGRRVRSPLPLHLHPPESRRSPPSRTSSLETELLPKKDARPEEEEEEERGQLKIKMAPNNSDLAAPRSQSDGKGGGSGTGKWRMAFDPSSGDMYYFHTATRETSWERPVTFEQDATPADDNQQNGAEQKGKPRVEEDSPIPKLWSPTEFGGWVRTPGAAAGSDAVKGFRSALFTPSSAGICNSLDI